MRIVAVADLHGFIPSVPECDMVLIAGDLTWHRSPMESRRWLESEFSDWVRDLQVPVIAIAGNHDEIYEPQFSHLLPTMPENYRYLQDQVTTVDGLSIFGSPWTKTFMRWHFMKSRHELELHFRRVIPPADIYVMHSAPWGYGDWSLYNHEHTGSVELHFKIKEYRPKLVAWGHIHSAFGQYQIGDTLACNVSLVDEDYRPTNGVTVIDYDGQRVRCTSTPLDT